MQNAKDTFYVALRDRLAALNSERTVVVRGVTRPGVLVDENEIGGTTTLRDCFHLQWTGVSVACDQAMPLVSLTCEITYDTAGLRENDGLDRGRALAAMDAALFRALQQTPQSAPKADYRALTRGEAPSPMKTRVWWSDPVFGDAKGYAQTVGRSATVQVMSLMEDGEQ